MAKFKLNPKRLGITMFKRWRLGEYIRQFSIVTAGVMVTFIGSDLITNYSTQKEIKSGMQLIISELKNNQHTLLTMKEKYETDRKMADYLIDSSFVISKFPIDTLKKYNRFVSNISAFFYSDDALEVLKNSNLMQKVEDKAVLLSIIEAYKSLYETQQSIQEYYNMKSSIIVEISLGNDMMNDYGSIESTWEKLFANNSMRSFCGIANRFFNYSYFDDTGLKLEETINLLEKNYQ